MKKQLLSSITQSSGNLEETNTSVNVVVSVNKLFSIFHGVSLLILRLRALQKIFGIKKHSPNIHKISSLFQCIEGIAGKKI